MKVVRLLVYIPLILGLFLLDSSNSLAKDNVKIGIVFSETSQKYSLIERSAQGKVLNGFKVMDKVRFAAIKDREQKMYLLMKELGYSPAMISDADLANRQTLDQYDAIIFTYTVMMSKQQREAVKGYIENGGNAIFAFATARNGAEHFPKEGEVDLSPLIYHTRSFTWEWGELSEVFNSRFVDDIHIQSSFQVKSTGNHPIIRNALQELGQSSLTLTSELPNGDWIEILGPYPHSQTAKLLTFEGITKSSKPGTNWNGSLAGFTSEFGRGNVVVFTFKIFDYFGVDGKGQFEWTPQSGPAAFPRLSGEREAKALLKHSVKWLTEKKQTSHLVDRSVSVNLSGVSAYARANDYIVYGTMQATNTGNTPSRGTMTAELLNENNQVVNRYDYEVVGLVPKENSYPEKLALTMKKPGKGEFRLRVTYKQDGQVKAGAMARFSVVNNQTKELTPQAGFTDVPVGHHARADILNLYSAGIVNGYNRNLFRPDVYVTRLQAATMLVNALNLPTTNRPNPRLSDVAPGQYGYDVIATAVDAGLFKGSNGKFNANGLLTRAQMAQVLVNAFQFEGETSHRFKDVPDHLGAKRAIDILYDKQITTGYKEDNTFRPNQPITRAQFAIFLNKALAR